MAGPETIQMKTATLSEADIKPYAKNAKKHPESQLLALAKIVAKVGWRQPVLVNLEGVIIAGHGRWFTYLKHKDEYQLKPIWAVDTKGRTVCGELDSRAMTPEEESAYRLADNKLNESEWDMEMALPELKMLSPELFELTGFDPDLLIDPEERDDEVPETPVKARSKAGDLYELGPHRLLCGDATKVEDMERLMAGRQADMVFTDPPYNMNYSAGFNKKIKKKIQNDNLSEEDFLKFLRGSFARLSEFTKRSAPWYVCHSYHAQRAFEEAIKANGYLLKAQIIWEKPAGTMGWQDYRTRHEVIFYCVKDGSKANFYGDRTHTTIWKQEPSDKAMISWLKKQIQTDYKGTSSIWVIGRENITKYVHPTQKPVELVKRAMVNSSKEDDIVLDSFLGSGSTLITAEKCGRACYGTELDPRYVDVIVERYVQYADNRSIIKNGKTLTWEPLQSESE